MKKIFLLLAVVAFAFTGCYDYEGPGVPNVGNLSFSQTLFELDSLAHDCNVIVNSDYDWTATSTDSWITVYSKEGAAGESELYFYVEPNLSSAERAGQIVVSCEDYNLRAVLDVFQSGAVSANEFTFTVTNIGEYGATFTVTAKEETRTFHWNCLTKADILEYSSTKDFMEEWHADMQMYVDNGIYTWAELLDTGSAEHTSTKLKPDTTYYLWAYGVDANGNCTSTDLSYYEFKTLPSTFDTNSWVGNWTLTPSKLFCEIISEQTWTQVLVANEQNTTRTLEIVDGATEDASLAGYALVYGWDANIPSAPALGKYVGNTIELLGDEIVAADGEYMLTWFPIAVNVEDSEDFLYAAGTADWLTPYTLTMNAEGTVNIKGATGLIAGASQYQIEVFKVEWICEGRIYSAMQAEDEMVYHLAGNTMTAVKTTLPEQLSVKKNIKIMHKYANAKSAAMQFSSAVKMAKLSK